MMVQCKAITNKNKPCQKEAKEDLDYCGIHRNYVENKKSTYIESEEAKELLRKSEKKTIKISIIIAVITTLLGIGIATYFFIESTSSSIKLSEQQINETILRTSYVVLNVTDTVNETTRQWLINVTNTHPLRESGVIYLYKIEKNPDKPNFPIPEGLKPGESKIFSLSIKSRNESVDYYKKKFPYGFEFIPPATEAYYVMNHVSITYKITCDNCPPSGIIHRYPPFQETRFIIEMNRTEPIDLQIPIYEWVDYDLEDIQKNKTKAETSKIIIN